VGPGEKKGRIEVHDTYPLPLCFSLYIQGTGGWGFGVGLGGRDERQRRPWFNSYSSHGKGGKAVWEGFERKRGKANSKETNHALPTRPT